MLPRQLGSRFFHIFHEAMTLLSLITVVWSWMSFEAECVGFALWAALHKESIVDLVLLVGGPSQSSETVVVNVHIVWGNSLVFVCMTS